MRASTVSRRRWAIRVAALAVALAAGGSASTAPAQNAAQRAAADRDYKGRPIEEFLSSGGRAALFGPIEFRAPREESAATQSEGPTTYDLTAPEGENEFVNDPCMDPQLREPFPYDFFATVQSETEIAVLNNPTSSGKRMVVGYNDSFGFDTNREGLSGFAYSFNGGITWIDGGGLPPVFPRQLTTPPPGLIRDQYFGDPVVVVHHATNTFYYSSLYLSPNGYFTLSVNRGKFRSAPAETPESLSNTRCLGNPEKYQVRAEPGFVTDRIIWDLPVEAVTPPDLGPNTADFLDKEWLYVDQQTGVLYMTYTRFAETGETPLELVVSRDGGQTWSRPRVIVPNLADTFNQATMPITTPTGRLIVTWFSRRFDLDTFQEVEQQIQAAYSDDAGRRFTPPITIAEVNPQGEPLGYNRARPTILNAPWIAVARGSDDGADTPAERSQPGFGNVYITYFSGFTELPVDDPLTIRKAAKILVSRSTDDGRTWRPGVRVNDDFTRTTHIFPTIQVDKDGRVFVSWIDRRHDPANNIMSRTFADVSADRGLTFGDDKAVSNIATSWYVRADAAPNLGDYNSSELLGFRRFVTTWADGRFRPPRNATTVDLVNPPSATPDVIYSRVSGPGFD